MKQFWPDSFGTLDQLDAATGSARFFSLPRLARQGFEHVSRMPYSIKVLLEAALRTENGMEITADHIEVLAGHHPTHPDEKEIPFMPARVLVQDFTGVPSMVDLAALRSAMQRLGGDPGRINPQVPVDLIIDHSVQVDRHGSADALAHNADREFARNHERYQFLHWAQKAFANLRVVPPASGICHQVNLEYLAQVVQQQNQNGETILMPDSLVGLDSHTTMINGLGVLGWGVGGIEAEAVMLGQPVSMLLPQVIGVRLVGSLRAGVSATDLALAVTEVLRKQGVVGKFVEFFGSDLAHLGLADRATIANMAPEYGATCGFFPVDQQTLDYLRQTGRPAELIDRVERYCKTQTLFREEGSDEPIFFDQLELSLADIQPSVAGPARPQDRVEVSRLKQHFSALRKLPVSEGGFGRKADRQNNDQGLQDGSVVIAAITSCTNTSNPALLLGAGLLAKKAVEAGLSVPATVKTSLAPGSKVVTHYLTESGLLPYLEKLGFQIVAYGCTTCIGNSGPLAESVDQAIAKDNLIAAAVLSGNRNFEGRIHPRVRASFLASPMLVVAYALAGTVAIDLSQDAIGRNASGAEIFLADLWPEPEEVEALLPHATDPSKYVQIYSRLYDENETWNQIPSQDSLMYPWSENSTYLQEPPFFTEMTAAVPAIETIGDARILLLLGDSVTTDHISPAGAIAADTPAGKYLQAQGIAIEEFNSYGSRRGNDRVMTRGTFANIRIRNLLAEGKEGGWTRGPDGQVVPVYEAACQYQQSHTPTLVIAGRDYGMGSSRDWAAKGTKLLGVRAVIAVSFERIHRSNLLGMGVLPLQFEPGDNAESLGLNGHESYSIAIDNDLSAGQMLPVQVKDDEGNERSFTVRCRIDTPVELSYYRNGGILQTVLRNLLRD